MKLKEKTTLAQIKKVILKNIQKSELILVISTLILVVLPFAVALTTKKYFPQKYAFLTKLLMEYNTIIFIIMLLTFFVLIAYVINYKETKETRNIKEKQEIIEQLTYLLNYLKKYSTKLSISDEMLIMFEQKIQILNKQINSEEYRNYPIKNEFFVNFKKVNSKIEDKILEVI